MHTSDRVWVTSAASQSKQSSFMRRRRAGAVAAAAPTDWGVRLRLMRLRARAVARTPYYMYSVGRNYAGERVIDFFCVECLVCEVVWKCLMDACCRLEWLELITFFEALEFLVDSVEIHIESFHGLYEGDICEWNRLRDGCFRIKHNLAILLILLASNVFKWFC